MWKCCVKAHNHPHHTLLHCSVMTYICLVLWHNNKTELFLQSEPMTLSQSLSMFGNILCLLRRVLVQIWSAARTANCCSVSRRRREREREREREAVSAIDWVARNQFCNSSRKLRGLGGGVLASSDLRSRHQTAQYRQYNPWTLG